MALESRLTHQSFSNPEQIRHESGTQKGAKKEVSRVPTQQHSNSCSVSQTCIPSFLICTSSEAQQSPCRPALAMARARMTLQLSQKVVAPGWFSLNASAAGTSYSIAHLLTAALAWCSPSLRPPQPAKMSMVARATPSSSENTSLRSR